MELDVLTRLLRRRLTTLAVVVAVCVAGALALSLRAEPVYASSTTLIVTITGEGSSVLERELVAQDRARTYASLVGGDSVLRPAAGELGLDDVDAVRRQVRSEHVADTPLLVVTAEAGTPEAARDLAGAVARQLAASGVRLDQGRTGPGLAPAVRVVEEAALPTDPAGASPALSGLLGLVLGLVLGLATAVLHEALDRTVRHPADVQRITGRPVLGAVPADDGPPQDATAGFQGYLGLAARLRHREPGGLPPALVVTSALRDSPDDPGDEVADRLVAALRTAGADVALLDLRELGADPACPDEDGQATGPGSGPSAGLAPWSADGSPEAGLVRALNERRDRDGVVVAAPSATTSPVPLSIAARAGAALVVAHYGRTRQDDLVAVVQALEAVGADVLGVVLHGGPARGPDAVRGTVLPPGPLVRRWPDEPAA